MTSKLDPPPKGGKFADSETPATLAYARDFADGNYFDDLCDLLEPIVQRSTTGARKPTSDYLRTPNVPCHVTGIAARYAGGLEGGRMLGGIENVVTDVEESLLFLPFGTPVAAEDRVKVHATAQHGDVWLSVRQVNNLGTYNVMLTCRVVAIGIPEGLE